MFTPAKDFPLPEAVTKVQFVCDTLIELGDEQTRLGASRKVTLSTMPRALLRRREMLSKSPVAEPCIVFEVKTAMVAKV